MNVSIVAVAAQVHIQLLATRKIEEGKRFSISKIKVPSSWTGSKKRKRSDNADAENLVSHCRGRELKKSTNKKSDGTMLFARIKKVITKKWKKKKRSNLTSSSRSLSITSGTVYGSSADADDHTDTGIGEPTTSFRSMTQFRLEESYQKSEQEKAAAFAKIKELEVKLLEEAYQKSEREKAAAFVKIKELEEKLNQQTKEDINHVPSVIDVHHFDSNVSHIHSTNDDYTEKSARDLPQLLNKDYKVYFDGSKSYLRTDDDNEISAKNLVQCLRYVKSKNERIADVCSEISLSSSRRRSPTPPRSHRSQEISGSSASSMSQSTITRRGGRRRRHRECIASTSLLETQVTCF